MESSYASSADNMTAPDVPAEAGELPWKEGFPASHDFFTARGSNGVYIANPKAVSTAIGRGLDVPKCGKW
jgi:hypothetical protein